MRGLVERRLQERSLGGYGPISRVDLSFWVRAQDVLASPVATWPDISGNGNDFTQPTGANQPVLAANVLNGYPAVQFDGSNDWVGSTISTPQPVTWAGVTMALGGSGDRAVIGSRNEALTSQPGAIFYLTGGNYTMFAGGNAGSAVNESVGWVRFAVSFNSTLSRRYINAAVATVNPGTRGPGLITLGAYISTGTTRTAFWNGYIVEALGWSRALNDDELGDVMSYLALKYAL